MAKVFTKIKSKVTGVATCAKRSTKRLAEATKLKFNIKIEEANLEEDFEKIGRFVFLNANSEENYDAKIAELMAEAGSISEKIKAYKLRLAELEDKEVCNHCDSVIERDFPCEYCDEKIVKDEAVSEAPMEKDEPAQNNDADNQ